MEHNYFPQRPNVTPTIYAYRLIGVDSHKGYLKVGYTDRTAKERIDEQLHTSKVQYEIVLVESAMSNDGSCFTDKDVHRLLERKGCKRLNPLDKTDEWFRCSVGCHLVAPHRGCERGEQNAKLYHAPRAVPCSGANKNLF